MHTAVRPWVTTGVALIGASVITVTPVAPPPPALAPQVRIPEVHMPAVQLSASVAEIFTFPAFRQYILNQIDDLVTLGVGLGRSAAGLGHSIAQIPATVRTVTQQVLSGDLLGALTTIEASVVGTIVAVGEPTLAAIIERRQRYLAVQQALQVAAPEAFFDVVGGVGRGADEIARAFIIAGQDLVDAVLSLNLGDIANALVNGTRLVLGSFVDGGQHVVDGIVAAQQTIATALAAQPAASSATAFTANISSAQATDVPHLSRKNAMVTVSPPTDTADAPTAETAVGPSESTAQKAPSTETETPKADEDKSATPAKNKSATADTAATKDESATEDASAANGVPAPTGKLDHPRTKSPKQDTEKKRSDSSRHKIMKGDNESQSQGGKEK